MASILYNGINQLITTFDQDSTLLDISLENKIPHLHECGGNGRCTTCRVRVIEGHQNLSARTMVERNTAHLRRWDPAVRLACQCRVKGDVVVQRLVWTGA
ncbi:MAG: 2Fe-2S iron-sulfur cluster-binding protein [Saprospiraceae bacterium]